MVLCVKAASGLPCRTTKAQVLGWGQELWAHAPLLLRHQVPARFNDPPASASIPPLPKKCVTGSSTRLHGHLGAQRPCAAGMVAMLAA